MIWLLSSQEGLWFYLFISFEGCLSNLGVKLHSCPEHSLTLLMLVHAKKHFVLFYYILNRFQ